MELFLSILFGLFWGLVIYWVSNNVTLSVILGIITSIILGVVLNSWKGHTNKDHGITRDTHQTNRMNQIESEADTRQKKLFCELHLLKQEVQ